MRDKLNKNILTLIFAVICQFALLSAVSYFSRFLADFPLSARIALMFICQWVFLPVPLTLMVKNKERLRDIGFSDVKVPLQILTGLLIAVVMCLILTVMPILLGHRDMVSSTRYSQAWQFVFEFFYTIFGVALTEEFFFRGYLYKKLFDIKSSKLFAILISSVIFGLFHIFAGGLIQVIVTTVIGVIFCLCREKIKNCTLLSLIVAHGIYDALIVVCVSFM